MNSFPLVAKTVFGLEEVCMKELEALGATDIQKHNRAVSFNGDLALIYAANYTVRTALRILIPVKQFEVNNEHELYNEVKKISWEDYIEVDDTFAIDCVLNTEIFNHSQYIAQKTKDAIADRFRDKLGKRPSVDLAQPTLRIHLHIYQNTCSLAFDSSGESLHKRGYREKTNLAPINEVLAAGLVLLTGWDAQRDFIDPMCGSGTIVIEAAMIAANIPSGTYKADFGFMRWKKYLPFDEPLWQSIKATADAKIKTENIAKVFGGDISHNVARKAKENVKRAHVEHIVQIRNVDMQYYEIESDGGVVVMNPPYGERMVLDDLTALYKSIGDTFKQRFTGYDCWLISANMDALKNIGLKPSRKIPIYNGPLECRFVKYEMYRGTKRTTFKQVDTPTETEE